MTQPDYPLPVLPSYELYQLAHIATFLADGLSRHHHARTAADRAAAVRGHVPAGGVTPGPSGVPERARWATA